MINYLINIKNYLIISSGCTMATARVFYDNLLTMMPTATNNEPEICQQPINCYQQGNITYAETNFSRVYIKYCDILQIIHKKMCRELNNYNTNHLQDNASTNQTVATQFTPNYALIYGALGLMISTPLIIYGFSKWCNKRQENKNVNKQSLTTICDQAQLHDKLIRTQLLIPPLKI